MKLHHIISACLILLIASALFQSCRTEEEFTDDPSATLSFSDDTIMFDTVFSQFGTHAPLSITKQLWVKNNSDKAVRVNISMLGTGFGVYLINVDGQAGGVYGKEIRGKDSIVIFIQVYLNPGNASLPFIVTDQLLFETNGNKQDVDLVSWGQDAHYFTDSVLPLNTHWTNDKPYVIYNSVLVPKGGTLTIDEGAKIHSHVGSFVYVAGTLVVNGSTEKPVVFDGDRLDPGYRDNPGQWSGIRLLPGSKDNVIKNAVIKNGVVGVEADSVPVTENPNLFITQSYIQNMTAAGLVGYSSSIVAINNVIGNCGVHTFYGVLGGTYKLYHNTFAAYNTGGFNRQKPQFILNNSPFRDESEKIIARFPLNYILVNNIIYGNLEEELILDNDPDGDQTGTQQIIQNNLVRTKITLPEANDNLVNTDPLFENISDNKFAIKENSPAKGKGININIATDIRGRARSATPTLGAYE